METLQDFMTTPVVTIEPELPVSHGLDLMEHHQISSLVIAKDNIPLGIFTERTLLQIRAGMEIDYSLPIKEVMSSPPYTALANMDYQEAYQMMLHHGFRHLISVDNDGHLLGIITVTDFLSNLGLEYFMEFKTVAQIMSRNVISLKPTSSVSTAMKLMNNHRISCVVIEEHGIPEGIITERDLLRIIRLNVDLENIQLFEVMSHPVQTIFSDVSNHDAAHIFMKKGLRRLVVTNSSGHCVGIVTETDMVKGLHTSYTEHLKKIIEQQAIQLKGVKKQMEEKFILDSMLQSMGDIAISIMDNDLRILLHNQAAEKLYDISKEEICGKDAVDLYNTSGNKRKLKEALSAAGKEGRFEFILEQKLNGTTCFLSTTIFSISDRANNKHGFGLIAQDITRQRKAVQELELKQKEVEDSNIALRIMLDQHMRTKETLEEQVSIKLKELVNPYLDLLRKSAVNEQQNEAIQIISGHIDSITQRFSPNARKIMLNLSPREVMIADLVRQGKTSKDISALLNISLRTVETYRNNLRKKLNIGKKKIGLQTYLLTHFTENPS